MKSFNECAITKFVANFIVKHSTKELLCKWNDQENIKAFNAIVKINQRASPKKGKSAYNFFCLEMRPQLKKELGKEGKLITAELSKRWKIVKENKDLLDKYTQMTEKDCYKKEKTSCESVQSQKVSVVNAKCITDEYKNMTSCEVKEKILKRFNENVRGQKPENLKATHNGAEGHWLEDRMGVKHNSSKEPDIFGYEMKKGSLKITLIDKVASKYLYQHPTKKCIENNNVIDKADIWSTDISRQEFIRFFGTNTDKKAYSWSGKCFPKYGLYNSCGQIIKVVNNNICIYYSYSKDERKDVDTPEFLKCDNILIAIWLEEDLKPHINKKFNDKGFFICYKTDSVYDKISFGKPFDFDHVIENIKNGNIIIDSGATEHGIRFRSTFRGNPKKFWRPLIFEEF